MNKFVFRNIILVLTFGSIVTSYGQNTVTFTFTGVNESSYYRLDSITVKNLTRDCDTTLYYPDTVLVLNYLGIKEKPDLEDEFTVLQNFPNPVTDRAIINMWIPERDQVNLIITNVLGQQLIASERMLERGCHSFLFTSSGEKLYLLTVSWKGTSRTIKILNAGSGSARSCSLEYSGSIPGDAPLKSVSSIQEFLFSPGDELMLIGYGDELESGFIDSPETSQDYVFQFATNIPCPGLDSLYYDEQWYHTIQVFSQCWLIENMNAGVMVSSTQGQANNGIVEKYCMGDIEYYCSILGGLYSWDEMMKYTYENEGQGICPEGFHVPGDLEWQILEGATDSESGIGDPEWQGNGWRGTDAGGNLKQTGTSNWVYPNTGATDAFGFTALPAGYFVQGSFWGDGYKTYLWSSQPSQKYYRNMDWDQAMIQRNNGGGNPAFSVRCIGD